MIFLAFLQLKPAGFPLAAGTRFEPVFQGNWICRRFRPSLMREVYQSCPLDSRQTGTGSGSRSDNRHNDPTPIPADDRDPPETAAKPAAIALKSMERSNVHRKPAARRRNLQAAPAGTPRQGHSDPGREGASASNFGIRLETPQLARHGFQTQMCRCQSGLLPGPGLGGMHRKAPGRSNRPLGRHISPKTRAGICGGKNRAGGNRGQDGTGPEQTIDPSPPRGTHCSSDGLQIGGLPASRTGCPALRFQCMAAIPSLS